MRARRTRPRFQLRARAWRPEPGARRRHPRRVTRGRRSSRRSDREGQPKRAGTSRWTSGCVTAPPDRPSTGPRVWRPVRPPTGARVRVPAARRLASGFADGQIGRRFDGTAVGATDNDLRLGIAGLLRDPLDGAAPRCTRGRSPGQNLAASGLDANRLATAVRDGEADLHRDARPWTPAEARVTRPSVGHPRRSRTVGPSAPRPNWVLLSVVRLPSSPRTKTLTSYCPGFRGIQRTRAVRCAPASAWRTRSSLVATRPGFSGSGRCSLGA